MFTSQLTQNQKMIEESGKQLVQSYYGVDLTAYQCYQLKPDPVYSAYAKEDVHFAINAMQKGIKPPTKIGIKRIKRRNYKKKTAEKLKLAQIPPQSSPLQNNAQKNQLTNLPPLNPKSPQHICLKALRRQFRQQIAPTVMEDQNQNKSISAKSLKLKNKKKRTIQQKNASRKPKFIRKKQNQLRRRIQLVTLLKQNYLILRKTPLAIKLPHRIDKMKCPRNISRQEIRDAISEYYRQQIAQSEQKISNINDPSYIQKIIQKDQLEHAKRVQKRKRRFQQYQRNHKDQYDGDSNAEQNRLIRRRSDSEQSDEQIQSERNYSSIISLEIQQTSSKQENAIE